MFYLKKERGLKNYMKELFKLKKLYFIALILTGIIFIILVNFNHAYKSEGEILVIFKSERATQNSDQILENLKIITQTLPFYKKVISDEPDTQNELVQELPDYKQKQYWNKAVQVERIGNSSVLKVSAISSDSYTAQILDSQTIKTLISIVGTYYNIEKDIDIRIINPPIARDAFIGSYVYLIFESVLIGFILTILIISFLTLIFEIKPKKRIKNNTLWSYKQKEIPLSGNKKANLLKKKSDELIPMKRAVAPENLPIFDDSSDEKLNLEEQKPITHEATPEEIKERLNKLLNGEI